jgi:Glucose / Sorbosone dehydrogenase
VGAVPRVRRVLLLVCLAAVALPASAQGAVSLEPVGTFDGPIGIVSPPGDTSRLLVVERGGRVRLVKNGVVQGAPFLDISGLVDARFFESGLLSIALAPDYATTGRFYAYYTAAGSGASLTCSHSTTDADRCPPIRIDEFRSSGGPADSASAATRRPVMEISHPKYFNHYGGQLQFDRAGRLYIGVGDGGSGGDPDKNAQNLQSPLGKILRIDPRQSGAASYTVPSDNPFLAVPDARREIWSYGLRNPFRFSFDRVQGDLTIGDVGQNRLEEIDFHARAAGAGAGRDFGWNRCEGNLSYPITGAACPLSGANYVGPIHQYENTSPCRSVIGGYVSRDSSLEELLGRYVYSDFCTSQVRRLNVPAGGGDTLLVDRPDANASSFGEDACGRVYLAELYSGAVSRLTDGSSACTSALPLPPVPPGGAGVVAAPPDTRAPVLGLRTGRRQRVLRNRGVIVRVRCDEPCTYRVGARLNVRRGKRKIRARQATGSLAANRTKRLRLRFSKPSARTLRRALRRKKRVRVRVEVRVRDRSGNLRRGSRLLGLVR